MKANSLHIMTNSLSSKGALNRISALSRLLALCALICVGNAAWAQFTVTPYAHNGNTASVSNVTQGNGCYDFKFTLNGTVANGSVRFGLLIQNNSNDVTYNVSSNGLGFSKASNVYINNIPHSTYTYECNNNCNPSNLNTTIYAIIENGEIKFTTTPPTCGPSLTATCSGSPTDLGETDRGTASTWTRFCTVSGSALTGNVTISCSDSDIEIATESDGIYTVVSTLTAVSSSVSETLHARLKSTASSGTHTATITFTTSGANPGDPDITESCSLSGTVNGPSLVLTPDGGNPDPWEFFINEASYITMRITGSLLTGGTGDVTVTAGSGLQVSTTEGSGWSSSISYTPSSENVNETFYVLAATNNTAQTVNSTLTIASTADAINQETALSYTVKNPSITNFGCPSTNLIKGVAQQLSVTAEAPDGYTLTVSSNNSDIKFCSTANGTYTTSLNLTGFNPSATKTFFVKYEGTTNVDNQTITYNLTNSSNTTENSETCNSISCSNWAPSIQCYSYFVDIDTVIKSLTFDPNTMVGYFDIKLKDEMVTNPANKYTITGDNYNNTTLNNDSKNSAVAWGAVQLDLSGMGVNSVGTTLPSTIGGSAGLYWGSTNSNPNDQTRQLYNNNTETYSGEFYYLRNNTNSGATTQTVNNKSFTAKNEITTGFKNSRDTFWSCNNNVITSMDFGSQTLPIGFFAIDDNADNRNTSRPANSDLHETHRIYFYKDNGDKLYYGFDSLPEVTLTTVCQNTANEEVTITATVQHMVNSDLTYTLYKNGVQVDQVTGQSTLTKTFNVNEAGNYYVTVAGKQKQMEIKTDNTEQPGNRLSVFRTSNTVIVKRCNGFNTPALTASATDFCPGSDVTISMSDHSLINNETATSWQWYKGDGAVGSASNTYQDLTITGATDGDNGTYKLGVQIEGDWYYSDTVKISALPTTITATPTSLSFNADGQQTITIEPTCASISDVTLTAPTGLLSSDFTVTSNTADLRNGGTITVTLSQEAFDALADGDYTTGGNIQITGSDGVHDVGLEVSKVSCKESNVVFLDFGTGVNNEEISDFTSPVNYSDYIQLEVNTYSSDFSDWAKRYAITPLRSSSNASNMSGINSSNTNRMLAFTLFGNDNSYNNIYHDLFIVKAPNNIGDNTYKIILKAKSIGHSDTYRDTKVKIKGTATSVNGSWENISLIVSKSELTNGVLIQAYRTTDTRQAYAFDDITITSVCPPHISSVTKGDICTICSDNTGTGTITAALQDGQGTAPFTYQWYKDNTEESSAIEEATSEILTLTSTSFENGATYYVIVTDANGLTDTASLVYNCNPTIESVTADNSTICPRDNINATVGFKTYSGYDVNAIEIFLPGSSLSGTADYTYQYDPAYSTDNTLESQVIALNGSNTVRGNYSVRLKYNNSQYTEPVTFTVKEKQFCNATTGIANVSVVNDDVTVPVTINNRVDDDFDGYALHVYTDEECTQEVSTDLITVIDGSSITVHKAAAGTDGEPVTYYIKAVSTQTAAGDDSQTPAQSFTVTQIATSGGATASLSAAGKYCQGGTIVLTASTTGINTDLQAINYKFYLGGTPLADPTDGTQNGNTFTYNVPADQDGGLTFTVEVDSTKGEDTKTIATSAGVTYTLSNVSVATPTLATSVATPTTCDAFSVTAGDVTVNNGTNDTEYSYYWTIGDATQSEQSATLTGGKLTINPLVQNNGITTPTTYTLTIEAGNGLCSDSVFSITVNPQPCKAISLRDTGYCKGQTIEMELTSTATASGINYSWYKCSTDSVRTGASIGSGLTQSFTEGSDFTHANEDSLIVKVIAYSGLIALDSAVAVIRPRTDCVQEYFVRKTDNSNTGDGSSWGSASSAGGAGAFKTIDDALNAAATLHSVSATADKRVAIYVYADADQSISTPKDTLRNISIYGGYSGTDYTSGTKTDGANGYTTITRASGSGTLLKAGSGENIISRLDFNNANDGTARLITSIAGEENNLVVDNCKFVNTTFDQQGNGGGGIKFSNTSNGGNLTIYDSYFSGNKAGDGGAVFVDGPYDVLITSKNSGNIVYYDHTDTLPTENNCGKNITINLLKVGNDGSTFANIFDNNLKEGTYNGGSIYLKDVTSSVINCAEFKNNRITVGDEKQLGGCIYAKGVNKLTISNSFFHNNLTRGSDANKSMGACIFTDDIASAEISYCRMDINEIIKGYGAAIAQQKSNSNIKNTYIGNGTIGNGMGSGFYGTESTLLNFKECLIERNKSTSGGPKGGGAYIKGAVCNMDYVIFKNNLTGESGGGFVIEGNSDNFDENTILSLTNSYLRENLINSGNGSGGAILAKNANIRIEKSYFYRNNAMNETGAVDIANGKSMIFSSTFYENRGFSSGNKLSVVSISGTPDNSVPNSYIYNCTFYGNGIEGGCIDVRNGAYADIVSNTIIKNDNRRSDVNASSFSMTDIDQYFSLNSGDGSLGICVRGESSKANVLNNIISGNKKHGDSTDINLYVKDNRVTDLSSTQFVKKAYNTIGSTIYFDNKGTKASTNSLGCDPAPTYSVATDMEKMCTYVAPIAPTAPFANQTCRTYGMSRGELRAHAGGDPILLAELLQDEHLQPRGWKSLGTDCKLITCLSDDTRTYQGAVEGGTDQFDGKKFDVELSRMVGLCVGGELSDPYIDIMLFDSETHKLVASGSLINYSIAMNRVDTTNKTITIIEKAIDSMAFTLLADTAYYRYEKPKSGIYQVNVYRQEKGKTAEVEHSTITVESLGSTALAWTGAANDGDYNNINNWVYLNDDGTYTELTSAQKELLPRPSSCYDVHIGWDNPTPSGNAVSQLPTINSNYPNPANGDALELKYGECHDIYFHPNGSLGQIHKLSYNKAFVELELNSYSGTGAGKSGLNWSLLAPPLKEVYSGDYYNDGLSAQIRYIEVKQGGNNYVASWSKSINTLDVDLTRGLAGFAFRFYVPNSGYKDSTHIYSFPNDRTNYEYKYYGTGSATGNKVSLSKSSLRNRFITEDGENKFIDRWTQPVDLSNRLGVNLIEHQSFSAKLDTANGFVCVANPYMSHLNLDSFYALNSGLINSVIKVFDHKTQQFASYDAAKKEGTSLNNYVSPMQGFFVQPKSLSPTLDLVFYAPSMSEAAPTSSPDNKLRSSDAKLNRLTLTATKDGFTSLVSYISAAEGADAKFRQGEDIQTLFSESANVMVYSKAGDIPVDMNTLDIDSLTDVSVPVCLSLYKAGDVTIKISGAESFSDEVDDIYWIDANTGKKTSLNEVNSFSYTGLAKGKTEGRFSILFKQKKRVKMETSGSVCQGDAYTFYGQPVGTATPGKVSSRIVREGADADTAFSITLKVNPIYFVDVEATINEGEDYTENGFSILNAKAGSYEKKLFLDSREGCDSIITLSLTVNPTLYKALVYNGTDEPVEKWVTEDGTGLGLTGNALAYFEDVVPDALCSMTNVICKNGGSYSASKISLTADADFYAPYTFTADEIEFSHKPVAASEANGWQTIVLPFTATDFRNSGSADGMAASRLTPFNESDARKNGDFWLKPFSSSTVNGIGFGYPQASELKANTPYIVAYPGSSYGSKYSLEGQTITYSASSAVVEKTPSPIIKELGDYSVIGVTAATEVKDAYMLDVEKNSFCLAESGTAAPFTCYVLSEGGARTRSLTIYDDDDDDDRILTDTDGLTADGPALFAVIVKEKMAYIYASKAGKADVTDMTGRKVLRSVDYGKGMTPISGLATGAYIIGGVKTVIK